MHKAIGVNTNVVKHYIGKMLEDYNNVNVNNFEYKKDQELNVVDLDSFDSYVVYHNLSECSTIDWIPKSAVLIISAEQEE